ncbi:MAG: hypothetical protein L6R39_005954 [Caloplaca ligustica]|nr:MAG: hypothetical protein L6R39_005954 [Caloplaca ligustica]
MMACVRAMHALAGLDPARLLRSPTTFIHPRYPQVSVTIDGTPTVVRWARFLLVSAIRDMLTRNRFEKSRFLGYWEVDPVVTVIFERSNLHSGTQGKDASTDNLQRPQGGTTVVANAAGSAPSGVSFDFGPPSDNPAPSSNSDELHADIQYLPKTISQHNMFLAITWLLLAIAPHYYEPLEALACNANALTVVVKTIWNRATSVPVSEQTTLVGGDLINLVARLPEELLRVDMWREMNIAITEKASGVVLGRGVVRVRPLPGGFVSPLSTNVSTS